MGISTLWRYLIDGVHIFGVVKDRIAQQRYLLQLKQNFIQYELVY
jgi:hypothetical protein